jgi:hypothetical protein
MSLRALILALALLTGACVWMAGHFMDEARANMAHVMQETS